jgi:acyl-ACP thioesterase
MEPPLSEPPPWSERFGIRSFDVDATRRMTSPCLCRYFLEAAWNHAEALGVGFNRLQAQGKFWVLARLRIEVRQYPGWGDRVTLQTWPRGIKTAFALRDFELLNESGAQLVAGSSAWLVVDAVSKRPQRLHKLFPGLEALSGRAAIGKDPEKLADEETWESEFPVTARYTDIDVNRHVNSARYLGWMLDSYPAGYHHQYWLRTLEVNYLSETIEGEPLSVQTRRVNELTCNHSLVKTQGSEVCRARLEWHPDAGNFPPRRETQVPSG